ncbi:hypothetical protein EBZ39_16425 [bacterium]|nr:hypothetical protein [bacterium]
MREKKFRNINGFVEVYGDDGSLGYGSEKNSDAVGIYVVGNNKHASLAMTPRMARQIGERMIAWADCIDKRKKK